MAPADTVLSTRGLPPFSHIEMRFGPQAPAPTQECDAMNEAQFTDLKQTLVDLLTPGYELSKLCLAQMQARLAADAEAVQSVTDEPAAEQNEFLEGERKIDEQDGASSTETAEGAAVLDAVKPPAGPGPLTTRVDPPAPGPLAPQPAPAT